MQLSAQAERCIRFCTGPSLGSQERGAWFPKPGGRPGASNLKQRVPLVTPLRTNGRALLGPQASSPANLAFSGS